MNYSLGQLDKLELEYCKRLYSCMPLLRLNAGCFEFNVELKLISLSQHLAMIVWQSIILFGLILEITTIILPVRDFYQAVHEIRVVDSVN